MTWLISQDVCDSLGRLERRAALNAREPSDGHVPEAVVAVERRTRDAPVVEPADHLDRDRQRADAVVQRARVSGSRGPRSGGSSPDDPNDESQRR
jgi:hypothetical protein